MTNEPQIGHGRQCCRLQNEDPEGVRHQEGLRHVDHEGAGEVHADADGATRDDGGRDAAVLCGARHGHQV